MENVLIIWAILIPLIGSFATFIWGRFNKKTVSYVSMVFSAASLIVVIALYMFFSKGQDLRIGFDVGLPFQLALRADALGLFLALITTSLWFLVSIYSIEYIHEHKGIFACFMQLSLYGMLGVTFSENLFTLLLFFEIFSIASAILVIHELTPEAIRAGFQYLFISVVGTACLIVGAAILFNYSGSLNLMGQGLSILKSPGLLIFWLLLIGFGVKAGVFPVHIWLPEAHPIAPSSASALLSGVMIKAGAYGIIRVIYGVFGGKIIAGPSTSTILIIIALITMIGGSLAAITQLELKKMLAFSSVAQIGYILLGAALMNPVALKGAVLHILNHALMKGSLFLAAGAIIHKTGKRNLADLKGIGREMPVTMTIITLSAISMIGVPPFIGFFSKWLLAAGAMDASKLGIISPWASYVVIGSIVLSGLLNAVYYGPIILNGWFGGKEPKPAHGHGHDDHQKEEIVEKVRLKEPSWVMVSPMLILSASTLALGIFVKYPLYLVNLVIKMIFRS